MRTTKVKEEFEEMENLFEKRKGEGRWEKRKKILFIICEREGRGRRLFKKKKRKKNKNKNKEKKKKSKRERAFG